MKRKPLLLAACALLLAACSTEKPASKVVVTPASLKAFKPLPAVMESTSNPLTEEKIELGRLLYYDTQLSTDGDLSCNSCHMLDKYGVDNQPTSSGHKGQKGNRNSPTVYNAAGQFVQFWDGRAETVEEQAKGPVMNPVEMAMPSEKVVVERLRKNAKYMKLFKEAFPDEKDPVNFNNMATAIAAFERRLVTPSRWDKFLAGDQSALTEEEKAGFNAFMDAGCQACHMGAYVGGSLYQKAGAVVPWPNTADLGRFAVTKQDSDRMIFKVPTLRNIEKTGPYFHDGSVANLNEAVEKMAEFQLGKKLTAEETKSIVAWLKTLTGDIPASYIAKPEPATPATGKG